MCIPNVQELTKLCSRLHLKHDGTQWRTGVEVKGKLVNGVGSQSPSHRFSLPRNMVYPSLLPLMRTPRLPVVDWTDAPADLSGLVCLVKRRNLVSACVPSRFKCSLLSAHSVQCCCILIIKCRVMYNMHSNSISLV